MSDITKRGTFVPGTEAREDDEAECRKFIPP